MHSAVGTLISDSSKLRLMHVSVPFYILTAAEIGNLLFGCATSQTSWASVGGEGRARLSAPHCCTSSVAVATRDSQLLRFNLHCACEPSKETNFYSGHNSDSRSNVQLSCWTIHSLSRFFLLRFILHMIANCSRISTETENPCPASCSSIESCEPSV